MHTNGKLIVFEGPDGVGKTTLTHELVNHLNMSGISCDYLAFPGREPGTLGHHIYELHHNPAQFTISSINPMSLQMLHVASHIDVIERRILPTLASGKSIVLDRFWWSTLVYGKVEGINQEALTTILAVEFMYWHGVQPDIVFLIDNDKSFLADEPVSRWNKLRAAYYELADAQKKHYPVRTVVNNSDVPQTLKHIIDVLQETEKSLPTESISVRVKPSKRHLGKSDQLTLDLPNFEVKKTQVATPAVYVRLSPAQPTEVFDTYWKFATERQNIFFRRFKGELPPFTQDPILGKYRFTNAYRASDRVSQYLIRNVIYNGDQSVNEVFFRILLFKIFNRIGTWQLLQDTFGEVRYADYSFETYDAVITTALNEGKTLFSAAYIMPSGGSSFGFSKKHRNYFRLIEKMIDDSVPSQLADMGSMQEAFELLRSYPLLGDFLAYQYLIDINYSELTHFSEMSFVVPGPGARDGIRKCFHSLGGLNETDIIRLMADRQAEEFERLGLEFSSLWGRPLQLIDCQNLFCEVDKYARVAHPDIKGISDRQRIKQAYQRNSDPIAYWYPPNWGINDFISAMELNNHASI